MNIVTSTESRLTRMMQAMSSRTAWCLALVIGFVVPVGLPLVLFLNVLFDEPEPKVHYRVTIPNPAGSFVAVLEQLDAMDINAGELNVVHVLRQGDVVDERGDRSKTIVFYDDATNPAPRVIWLDDTHLSVSYIGGKAGSFMRSRTGGIVVNFEHRTPNKE